MQVKIISIYPGHYCVDDTQHEMTRGITDWEECTQKQYEQLRTWCTNRDLKRGIKKQTERSTYYVVVKSEEPIMTNIKELLGEFKETEKKDKAAKKASEARKKRFAALKAKSTADKDEAEYKRLKAIFGKGVK